MGERGKGVRDEVEEVLTENERREERKRRGGKIREMEDC